MVDIKFTLQQYLVDMSSKNTSMKTAELRQKLHHYIETAQEKKVKAIFAMVEEEIEETYDHREDKKFVAELQKREDAYLKGTVKTYTVQQSVARARQTVNKLKSK
jgi:hypothetical protein